MTAVEKLSRLNFPKTLTYYLHPVWSSAAQHYNASYHLTSLYNSSKCMHNLMQTHANLCWRNCLNGSHYIYAQFSLYSLYSSRPPSRSFRRRASKRLKAKSTPMLDEVQFRQVLSQLPPRFSSEELCNVITLQEDPLICLELFKWASQQPRFRHDASTYHITIKKLGVAKMYQEMDDVVNQVLAVPYIGTEPLYNSIIYFFTEARKLTRAVNIFKHMKKCLKLDCRPSIRTYNLLFAAFLSRGRNSYVNHVYMETIRGLFKQLVSDGIEPDIFTLNCMIKGYVLSLHVNDALRVFHQMDVVYKCQPNSFSYNYLIHGLCAQGRTINASELCNEMKEKGHTPSSKSYNSLVNALALGGEVEDAVSYLWEMIEKQISVDFITYRTIFDEICRQGRVEEAMMLLKDLQEKDVLDVDTYRKLRGVFEDDFTNTDHRNVFRCFSSSGPQILRVGDILRQSRIFSGEDIIDYSKVSHDSNPLHFDAEVARHSGFEDRLVHGMLVAALFPRIIASRFPGAIYVSQSLQFKWPVYVGDEVKSEIEAVNIRESKNKYMVKFLTKCFKRGELLVIDGEAVAILPSLALG